MISLQFELSSNVMCEHIDSGGVPAGLNRSLIHTIDESHAGDHSGELLESSKSSPSLFGTHCQLIDHRQARSPRETTLDLVCS
jgi:hypothetical protein